MAGVWASHAALDSRSFERRTSYFAGVRTIWHDVRSACVRTYAITEVSRTLSHRNVTERIMNAARRTPFDVAIRALRVAPLAVFLAQNALGAPDEEALGKAQGYPVCPVSG